MSFFVWVAIIAVVIVVMIVGILIVTRRGVKAENLFEDQLVVDKLEAADLKSWFMTQNPEKKHTSMVMLMDEENIKKYNLGKYVKPSDNNCLIQCIYDSDKDSIVCGRVIVYNSLGDKIAAIINNSNGAVIFD